VGGRERVREREEGTGAEKGAHREGGRDQSAEISQASQQHSPRKSY
jgi:hypothetical protein